MSDVEHITRACKVCCIEKPLSGYFIHKTGNMAGKPYGTCKVCRGERSSKWRKENPEKSRAFTYKWIEKNRVSHDAKKRQYMAKYRAENPEIQRSWRAANTSYMKIYMKRWVANNRDYVNAYDRAYRAKNADRIRSLYRERYARRSEHFAARARMWRAQNRERHQLTQRVARHKRRALKRNAKGTITARDIKFLFEMQRGMCPVCRKRLGKAYHLDHIIALAKGGSNELINAQLLHPVCNSRKSARDPLEFMQSQGFLL